MNGTLVYECGECLEATIASNDEIQTFSNDDGLTVKFVSECEWCGEKLEIEILVKD